MKLFIQVCFTITILIFLEIYAKAGVTPSTLFGLAGCGRDAEATLYTINSSTGAATAVGSGVGFSRCGGMDFDSNGTLFAGCTRLGTTNAVLITVDPTTGTGTEVGEMCGSSADSATDFSFRNADDVLFGILFETLMGGTCTDNGYQTINTTTGAPTTIGLSGLIGLCGIGTAFSPTDTLFLADEDCNACIEQMSPLDGDLYTVNQLTGAATQIATLPFPNPPFDDCARPNAMDFQPGNGVLFVSIVNGGPAFTQPRTNYITTINTTSGDVTVIGQTVECIDAIAFGPTPGPIVIIPTMGQWGMIIATILLGFFAIAALRKRRES